MKRKKSSDPLQNVSRKHPKTKKTGFIHHNNKKKDIVGNVFFTIQVCFCNGASMSGLVYIAYLYSDIFMLTGISHK